MDFFFLSPPLTSPMNWFFCFASQQTVCRDLSKGSQTCNMFISTGCFDLFTVKYITNHWLSFAFERAKPNKQPQVQVIISLQCLWCCSFVEKAWWGRTSNSLSRTSTMGIVLHESVPQPFGTKWLWPLVSLRKHFVHVGWHCHWSLVKDWGLGMLLYFIHIQLCHTNLLTETLHDIITQIDCDN